MAAGFISQDNFIQKLQVRKEEEKILNWIEFPSNGEIFRIVKIKNVKTKYGESTILHVEDANGDGDPRNDFSDPSNPTLPDYLNPKIK